MSESLAMDRKLPAAQRALTMGRDSKPIEPMDAAALVRETRDAKACDLVTEILQTPLLEMVEPVLHPLCAVNKSAAQAVIELCASKESGVAARANQARAWRDVQWPE